MTSSRDAVAVANRIAASNRCYELLESLCICFPGRISGSEILEKALDFLLKHGQETLPPGCCYEERVDGIPRWVRGEPDSTCTASIDPNGSSPPEPFPLTRVFRILTNGMSVGTSPVGVQGSLVIVNTWDQLKALGEDGRLQGAVVLYDYKTYTDYGTHSRFRSSGASEAARYGAVAVLIRTITPDSSTSGIHTGQMVYQEGIPRVPAACMAIEDVEVLSRLLARGHSLSVTIRAQCYQLPDVVSRNIIYEIKGCEFPDEVVVVGGHTDSWDCANLSCQGAHDDGQGVCVSMECVRRMHELGLRPKRTIRAVLFVDEECTQRGGICYARDHKQEMDDGSIVAAIETDLGAGPCVGFGYTGSAAARIKLAELLEPLTSLGAAAVDERWSGNGVDITPMIVEGKVPGLLLRHEDKWWCEDYFHFHHSSSDTIDHIDPVLLEQNLKVISAAVWVLANSDEKLTLYSD